MKRALSIAAALTLCLLCASARNRGETVRMGVSLPFSAEAQASVSNSLDFYCGVLIAVKELGDSGINIDLNCMDSDQQLSAPVPFDFIIGPIKRDALSKVLESVDSSIWVVSPLDHRASSLASSHKNFIQAAPSSAHQYKEACNWGIQDTELPKHHILITTAEEPQQRTEALEGLSANGQVYTEYFCNVSDDIEGLDMAFLEDFENIVIVAIANEAILNNAIRNISKFSRLYKMQVYCNNRIRSYETIPVENIHKISARCLCPYFIDYTDSRTLDFIHKYRALYNLEPNQFAFQGYDIAYFMISTFAGYGKEAWREKVTAAEETQLLQASFKLREVTDGGLVNEAVRKVEYLTDYRIISVK